MRAGILPAAARAAVGEEILHATGHSDLNGPWIPVGVGIHTGIAFVGAVHSEEGAPDITVLGDTVNAAARIASQAAAGEVIVSDAARLAAGLKSDGMKPRRLELKGRREPLDAWVKDCRGRGRGMAPGR